MIDLRDEAKATGNEIEQTLKIIANSASYGIFIEVNRNDSEKSELLHVYGPDGQLRKIRSKSIEERFARDLIHDKALSTLVTMEECVPRSPVWDNAHKSIAGRTRLLEKRSPRSVEELLGIEGSIANEYFRAWSAIQLSWKGLKQRPIPEDWQAYKSRSALREELRVNRGATHPVNAMLNYAYGVLIGKTQVQLIGEGYDPTIGILHGRESERGMYPAFALDRMEPMRPVVDRAVLDLVKTATFSGGDFAMQPDGVCRLNPQLARRVAQLAIELCANNR